MIGLSVSLCIKDIADGKFDIGDVEKIVAGTMCQKNSDWEEVIQSYRTIYWRNNPDECERILHQLLAEDKVYQPRVNGYRPPLLLGDNGLTKWVNSESEIRYCGSR